MQVRPLDELHGVEEELPFAVAGVEDADNVGVGQLGQGGGLAAQRPPGLLAGVVAGQHGLQHDETVDDGLLGPVLRHARDGAAEVFKHFVAGNDGLAPLVLVGRRERRRGGRRQGDVGGLEVEQRHLIRGDAAGRAVRVARVAVGGDGRLPEVAASAVEQFQMGNVGRRRGVRHRRRPPCAFLGASFDYRSDGAPVKYGIHCWRFRRRYAEAALHKWIA